ncbi:hypothetical protein RGQ29_014514 [Quercus rubra]|uniref:Flavin-containing monooxygenase n=1 Tax=Quercus rubra TaxID=3512 RepID=A0AAN7FLF2_QUERU|nr:hypothetical protein RGQ29_014514 [Quercus rubra]
MDFKKGSSSFDTIVFCTGFKRSTNLWLKISTLKDLILEHGSRILDEVHSRKSTGRVESLKD